MSDNVIYQQKDNSWMVNVLFYFMVAALVLVIFLYTIFSFKVYREGQKITDIEKKISVYGSQEEKEHEKQVFDDKKKIDDFASLIAEHKLSANIFNFLEANTLPGVVFSSFAMSSVKNELRLSGQSGDMATLGRQFQTFEHDKAYIKSISLLTTQTDASGKIAFVFNVSLDPKIFTWK